MDIQGTQTAPKRAFFGHFLPDFQTKVRHLCHPFLATTVEFLAHTLCDCLSHPYHSPTFWPNVKNRDRVVIFATFRACLLLLAC